MSNQTIIYQQLFRKIYNQTSGQMSTRWEYFVLGLRVYEWLADHDPIYINNLMHEEIIEAINEIFDIILALLEMLKSPPSLLSAVVYYANKFVYRTGIKHNQLFNLLLTSTIVTLKFWSESAPTNNKIIADIFEFPVHDINLMERRFLCGVDYKLQLTQVELDTFLSKINLTHELKSSISCNKRLLSICTSSQSVSSSNSSTSCIQQNQVVVPTPSPTPTNC